MLVAAAAGLVLEQLWELELANKEILLSSSFVLRYAGLSLVLLSLFYYVIDVQKIRGWIIPFVVIGSNSIMIYMLQRFVTLDKYFTDYIASESLKNAAWYPLVLVVVVFSIKWLFLYLLYR